MIAEITDYEGLVKALRERAQALHINLGSDEVANLTGLPDRYLTKVLTHNPTKRLGPASLGPTLALLGVKLIMFDDPKTLITLALRRPFLDKSGNRMDKPKKFDRTIYNKHWMRKFRAKKRKGAVEQSGTCGTHKRHLSSAPIG